MRLLLCLMLIAFSLMADGQTKITSIRKVADGLYLMYYDTNQTKHYVTKSTIVEFKDFVVLIEMPISTDGSGAKLLTDHKEGGELVLAKLKEQFPGKPLKYVLSTHWHPHSISSVLPFISRGINVVTTTKNYKRISEYMDSASFRKYGKYIRLEDKDGFTIKDKTNSIIAYHLDKKDYPHMPTEDFLFYYLPRYNYLHNSCMFQRLKGSSVKGKEMISVRVEDVDKFIKAHNLSPAYFITTDLWDDDASGMASGDTLAAIYRNGVTMTALENEILNFDLKVVVEQPDSVIRYILHNRIPNSIMNSAVYTCLNKNDLPHALAIARVQALNNPSDANAWDTFGEVYYFMGQKELAKKYEMQSKRIDKEFTRGGEASWERELKDFQARWATK